MDAGRCPADGNATPLTPIAADDRAWCAGIRAGVVVACAIMFDLGLVRRRGTPFWRAQRLWNDTQRSAFPVPVVASPAAIVARVADSRPLERSTLRRAVHRKIHCLGARAHGQSALLPRPMGCRTARRRQPVEVRGRIGRVGGTPCPTKRPRHLSPLQPTST